MTLVKIEIDLQREEPMEICYVRVERESKKYIYTARKDKAPKPLARAALHRPILDSPMRGRYFLLSETDDRTAIESSEAMQLGGILLLDEMEAQLQRCAARLNETMDGLYAMGERE